MKIRGNTVGTTISPERVLVGCKNLTEEQKAQARKNIGVGDVLGGWEHIFNYEFTEPANKAWLDFEGFAPRAGYKRVLVSILFPSEVATKQLYAYFTRDMWSSLFGYTISASDRKLLLDFEVVDDLGVTLQINGNGNNNSVANTASGKILRESTHTLFTGFGLANGNDGAFPAGTMVKVRGWIG